MIDKKYVSRNDLKMYGLHNLKFTRNRPLNKIFLTADYNTEVSKSNYNITFVVELDAQRNTKLDMVTLCKEMLLTVEKFKGMKVTDQKKYAEEHGEKIDY